MPCLPFPALPPPQPSKQSKHGKWNQHDSCLARLPVLVCRAVAPAGEHGLGSSWETELNFKIKPLTAMVDYSKWENIQDSDDENDAPPKSALPSNLASTAQLQVRSHIRVFNPFLFVLNLPRKLAILPSRLRPVLPSNNIFQVDPCELQLFRACCLLICSQHQKRLKTAPILLQGSISVCECSAAMLCQVVWSRIRSYEWEQSIDEVLLYIKTPNGVRSFVFEFEQKKRQLTGLSSFFRSKRALWMWSSNHCEVIIF